MDKNRIKVIGIIDITISPYQIYTTRLPTLKYIDG